MLAKSGPFLQTGPLPNGMARNWGKGRKLENRPWSSQAKQAEFGSKHYPFEKKADFLAQLDQFDRIVVAYEESAKEGEAAALIQSLTGLEAGSKLLFIFGPEGGLSPAEIESFTAKGAVLAGLGPRILRAETAPLYALSAVSVVTELIN